MTEQSEHAQGNHNGPRITHTVERDKTRHNGYPVLTSAPINEALLDIQTTLPEGTTVDGLGKFQDAIRDRFPGRRSRVAFAVGFKASGEDLSLHPQGGVDGYLFDSADGSKVVQARLDGFSFSKLRPYDRWSVFRDEASDLWRQFLAIVRPVRVNRIALRYINRIEVPLPVARLSEYLKTYPELGKGVPDSIVEYLMRVVVALKEPSGAVGVITEALDPSTFRPEHDEEPAKVAVLLDIDVSQARVYHPDDPAMWQTFEELRTAKDQIFFRSLSKRAKEAFR